MYIDILVEEHRHIKRLLAVLRRACYLVFLDKDIDYSLFYSVIDCVRNYADSYHHGKEEEFLFSKMVEHLDPIGQKMIVNGMLVEHDLGRLFISKLQEAVDTYEGGEDAARLDIIANAIAYADLLDRHIQKEDELVYQYALKNLPKDVQKEVEIAINIYEEGRRL